MVLKLQLITLNNKRMINIYSTVKEMQVFLNRPKIYELDISPVVKKFISLSLKHNHTIILVQLIKI